MALQVVGYGQWCRRCCQFIHDICLRLDVYDPCISQGLILVWATAPQVWSPRRRHPFPGRSPSDSAMALCKQVLQFPDIAFEWMQLQLLQHGGRNRRYWATGFSAYTLEDRPAQSLQVVFALAQRREVDIDDIQPVIEVLAERVGRDLCCQVFVCGADQPHIDNFLHIASRRADFSPEWHAEVSLAWLAGDRRFRPETKSPRAPLGKSRFCLASLRCRRPFWRQRTLLPTRLPGSRCSSLQPTALEPGGYSRAGLWLLTLYPYRIRPE